MCMCVLCRWWKRRKLCREESNGKGMKKHATTTTKNARAPA